MITQNAQLKLQAYLDGELPPRETAEVTEWLVRDRDATALLEELRGTNAVLAGYEAEIKLPETREFFWSKIEREIERQNQATPVKRAQWFGWIREHFLQVAGVTMVACLCGFMYVHSGKPARVGEMELASDEMGSYTFRDPQQKMTMVWLYDRPDETKTVSDTLGGAEIE